MKNKILIVDDEPEVCSMLGEFLVGKGYRTITALRGEEAIEKVKEKRPDIVLLDIKMPGIDGVETLKRIREFDKKVDIVMITKVGDDEIAKKCMDLGASDYITKPLGLGYLEKVLILKMLNFEKKE